MNENKPKIIIDDPWQYLKEFTKARIALGRCGSSIPTHELLDFRMAHAKAIDAVHIPLDCESIASRLESDFKEKVLIVHSAAKGRSEYLKRPDLGRILSEESSDRIKSLPKKAEYDISVVIADGLSATAIEKNVIPFCGILIPELKKQYSLAPIVIAQQGRVAIGDSVSELFHAKMVILLVGERPGLKSPDSMGIYMTYNPFYGITEDKRNCISNVREHGLSYPMASFKLLYLLEESFKRRISGVNLKDEQPLDSLGDADPKSLEI